MAATTSEKMRDCLVPKLDDVKPFFLQPEQRRPALVRNIETGTQIFAQDETVTLYVVEIAPRAQGITISIATKADHLRQQIEAAAAICGASRAATAN